MEVRIHFAAEPVVARQGEQTAPTHVRAAVQKEARTRSAAAPEGAQAAQHSPAAASAQPCRRGPQNCFSQAARPGARRRPSLTRSTWFQCRTGSPMRYPFSFSIGMNDGFSSIRLTGFVVAGWRGEVWSLERRWGSWGGTTWTSLVLWGAVGIPWRAVYCAAPADGGTEAGASACAVARTCYPGNYLRLVLD